MSLFKGSKGTDPLEKGDFPSETNPPPFSQLTHLEGNTGEIWTKHFRLELSKRGSCSVKLKGGTLRQQGTYVIIISENPTLGPNKGLRIPELNMRESPKATLKFAIAIGCKSVRSTDNKNPH